MTMLLVHIPCSVVVNGTACPRARHPPQGDQALHELLVL